ncbi:hypothetical protein [Actinomyces radicidentis]|uniref:hypothetical protein n=1 Tax=Actinomyces radicidentis TaxID=111015 RepID=UPI0028F12160|nr:hypothetical protein [Actinomyces radicidentis]
MLGSRRTEQGLRVRMALLASVANLSTEAADHLAAYGSVREPGPYDEDEECLTLTKRLHRRLDVHTRREAVRAARERGLLGRR